MATMLSRAAIAGLCMSVMAGAAHAQESESDPFAHAESLNIDSLSGQTVITDALSITQSTQTLTAGNSGNSVTGDTVTTGEIVLDASTFSGFSGIGNFLMNTGNNNNLQGAVSVVVVLPPP